MGEAIQLSNRASMAILRVTEIQPNLLIPSKEIAGNMSYFVVFIRVYSIHV